MSLAEEMLATMPLSDDSSTYSADEEPHIVINESRQAIVPNELKTIAVTGDKDIETVTFDCVRYWDGNDLSTFAIYLNYVLPDLTTGTYIPEKITTTDGDEFYHFDWQIKNNITAKSGKISFAVTAISTKPNWAGEPIVDKQWSSLPNSDCSIALGIEVSNVPSEEESSAVLAQMSAILEQIQADFDEWLKNSVVQTTGDSTTAVMSQRATTEEFDMLKARLKLYDAAYGIIATGLENTYYIAMRNSKQIDNLKSGISDQFETDSSIAYVKDVPSNAMPYAEVKKIGGMTYKDGNTLKSAKVTAVKSVGVNIFGGEALKNKLITDFNATVNADNETLQFDSQYQVSGYPLFTDFKPNTVYTFILYGKNTNAEQSETNTFIYYTDGDKKEPFYFAKRGEYSYAIYTSIAGKTIAEFGTVWNIGITELQWDKCGIFEGAITEADFKPYQEHTLPIPEAVQALDGWGQGIPDTDCYNFVDWRPEDGVKKYVRKTQRIVFDGTELWKSANTDSDAKRFILEGKISSPKIPNYDIADAICNLYSIVSAEQTWFHVEGIAPQGAAVWVYDSKFTTVQEFVADLAERYQSGNPVVLEYKLATPIETDISDLLPADDLISVKGGGTLTFENEYGYAVPSEVEYQVEV